MPSRSPTSSPWGAQLAHAMAQHDDAEIERLVDLPVAASECAACLDVWHALLLHRGHYSHQRVVFALQQLADPRSVPFLRQALATSFEHWAYSGSDEEVVAKWFSHALAAIGTPEARQVLREFARSPNPGIRAEMQYRLAKLEQRPSGQP